MTDRAVRLLQANPRLFWGQAIRILIERGWSPPPPDQRIVDDLLEAMANVPAPSAVPLLDDPAYEALECLTPREREVANLVAFGLTNRDIGLRLDMAEGTVKFHLSNVYRKTEVGSRAELVALLLGAP
jgi:two-component system nitrate/nitrite response regulator NarL